MAITQIPSEFISVNAISGTIIADNAVTAVHIATNAISGTLIADNAVTAVHIATNAVSGTLIADNAITAVHVAGSSITATQMQDNAIGTGQLAGIARGKIIYGDSSGDPQLLALGSNGQVLKSDGSDISWGSISTPITALNNATENELVTVGATTTELEAESGLTWDTNTLAVSGNTTMTTADNTDTLTLISTDADASSGPHLNLYRNSASPADSDVIGRIKFTGRNDNSQDWTSLDIISYATDVSDGSEDSSTYIYSMIGGTLRERIGIATGALVFNEDGRDLDFRVESNSDTHVLFVDGGNNNVAIGHSTATGAKLAICDGANAQIQFFPEVTTDTNLIQHYDITSTTYMNADNRAASHSWKIGTTEYVKLNSDGKLSVTEINHISSGSLEIGNGDEKQIFDASGATIQFQTADTERMRIDSAGKVGIGVTDPDSKLEIKGSGGSTGLTFKTTDNSSNEVFYVMDGGRVGLNYYPFTIGIPSGTSSASGARFQVEEAGFLTVLNTGNVGIGTTSPSRLLTVSSSGQTDLAIIAGTSASAQLQFGDSGDDNIGQIEYNNSENSMSFFTNAAEKMVIQSDGIVHITSGATPIAPTLKHGGGGAGNNAILRLINRSGQSVDKGGLLELGGVTDDGVSRSDVFGAIYGAKANATSANRQGYLALYANDGDSLDEFMRIFPDGKVRFGLSNAGNPNAAVHVMGGNFQVSGSITKGSGSFRIDHPLESKKDTHDLVHSFTEAPQADLIYRGTATLSSGTATVNIDTAAGMTNGTFVLLCGDVQCFTTNESNWDAVKGSVSGNTLTVTCENASSTATVSWLVIGERKDKHMIDTEWTDSQGKVIVEPLKTEGFE